MSDHDHDHNRDHDHDQSASTASDTTTSGTDTLVVPQVTAPNGGTVDARITDISDDAAEKLRRHVEHASGGGNRFLWFIGGFLAALLAGTVAAVAFLAISDRDDDGNVDLDVPAVELDVDP